MTNIDDNLLDVTSNAEGWIPYRRTMNMGMSTHMIIIIIIAIAIAMKSTAVSHCPKLILTCTVLVHPYPPKTMMNQRSIPIAIVIAVIVTVIVTTKTKNSQTEMW